MAFFLLKINTNFALIFKLLYFIRLLIYIPVLSLIPLLCFGQQIDLKRDFDKINSYRKLKNKLVLPTYSEIEKVQMIYSWMGRKVRYDLKTYQQHKYLDYSPIQVIRKKKGLCEDFAKTFVYLCKLANIKAFQVNGYVKEWDYLQNEPLLWANHAWIAFVADGKIYLADPSGSSGEVYRIRTWSNKIISRFFPSTPARIKIKFKRNFTYKYFCVSPSSLIQTHLPEDPHFQLLNSLVSMKEFIKGKINIDPKDSSLDFKGEIFNMQDWSEEEKKFYMAKEGRKFNQENNEIMVWPGFYKANEKLKIIKDIKDTKQLEAVVEDIIKNVSEASQFLQKYRNDLNRVKNLRISTFTKRNKRVISFFQNLKTDNTKQIDKIWQHVEGLKKENKKLEKMINSYHPLTLEYFRIHPKKIAQTLDSAVKDEKICKNKEKIKLLTDSIHFFDSQLRLYKDSLLRIMLDGDSIIQRKTRLYDSCLLLIFTGISQTERRRQLMEIEETILKIIKNRNIISDNGKKSKYESLVFKNISEVNKRVQSIKNLIRENQEMQYYSEEEDSVFVAAHGLLADNMDFINRFNSMKIEDNNRWIGFDERRMKSLRKEQIPIKKLLRSEKLRFKREIYNEKLKTRRYLQRTKMSEREIDRVLSYLQKT